MFCFWQCDSKHADLWKDFAVFAVALSFEPWYSLYLSWHDGKDSKQFVWNCISEGLMEAPSSSVLTVYIAMLFNSVRHQGPSSLFVMSILTSLLSTSRASTSIGFYGENPSLAEYIKTLALMKIPQVTSQVLGYASLPSLADLWRKISKICRVTAKAFSCGLFYC